MSGAWRDKCANCGAVFFGTRCQIFCRPCIETGHHLAKGTCYDCGAKVPPRYLFCSDCKYSRRSESQRDYQRAVGGRSLFRPVPAFDPEVVSLLTEDEGGSK